MALISSIFTPQESVNDEFLSLLTVHVKSGDFVKKDTLIAELETSKALLEMRSEIDGYISVFVRANTDVKVGSKMFEFYDSPLAENSANLETTNSEIKKSEEISKREAKFSKAAVEYIEKNNVDNSKFNSLFFVTTKDLIRKTEGKIKKEHQTLNTREKDLDDKTIKPISKTKKREIEYLSSVNSTSISRLSAFIQVSGRDAIGRAQLFIKSTPLPTIIQEVSKLLLKYPNLNSYYLNGDQIFYNKINVGFALDDGNNGLKVAALLDTNNLNLNSIENSISDLSIKYSNNQLNIQELTSATFTITDLFNTNIISFHPLLNYNNSSILGIASIQNGGFIVDLSFDHRISNGKEASRFLDDLKYRLESRFKMALDHDAQIRADIKCFKCCRGLNDDLNGEIYFQKVINSKSDGYICSNCLNSW